MRLTKYHREALDDAGYLFKVRKDSNGKKYLWVRPCLNLENVKMVTEAQVIEEVTHLVGSVNFARREEDAYAFEAGY